MIVQIDINRSHAKVTGIGFVWQPFVYTYVCKYIIYLIHGSMLCGELCPRSNMLHISSGALTVWMSNYLGEIYFS